MIITCPNCEKRFKIDNSLIPNEGRDLQCGSCEHVWFYKLDNESEAPLTLDKNVSESKVEANIELKANAIKAGANAVLGYDLNLFSSLQVH